MASRHEPPESLEFFPTPPWASRALFHFVLPVALRQPKSIPVFIDSAADPCCGEGHMAEVIAEFSFEPPIATDIFDYGYGRAGADFLDTTLAPVSLRRDWFIFNPPFGPSIDFVLRALEFATVGVAMFQRTQWIESSGRYNKIFCDRPPTLFAPFVERVPLVKGRWDPDASTATSYSWFVWVKGAEPLPPFWIPPVCRETLTHKDDRRRFAAWSIKPVEAPLLDHAGV